MGSANFFGNKEEMLDVLCKSIFLVDLLGRWYLFEILHNSTLFSSILYWKERQFGKKWTFLKSSALDSATFFRKWKKGVSCLV